MTPDDHQQLFELIHQVGNRFVALEKDMVIVHEGEKFHASEINFLSVVERSPRIQPTLIARRLNVTKGAVSQTMTRLKKKKAIRTEGDPADGKAVRISLSPLGEGALAAFHRQVETQWAEFSLYVNSLGEAEHRATTDFLTSLRNFLNDLG
jgi:DNA-binding MarR family transcriptional regulator